MEFMNRSNTGGAPQPGGAPTNGQNTTATTQKRKKFGGASGDSKGLRIASVVLLFSITILLVAFTALFAAGPKSEASYINHDRLQAVFLNGGQVYFGKITDLNDKYVKMEGIFYLRVNQVVQPNQQGAQQAAQNDISLVKLGCELHRPTNEMLINRSQVIFWENLKDEAGENTVPGAVKNYVAQYPNGQECQEANADAGGGAAGATNPAGATAPAGSGAGSDTDNGAGGLTN